MGSYESVDHPRHYGGGDDVYEHIKVARAWGLGYALGNATKYICRAGRKPGIDKIEDLQKAAWYIRSEIEHLAEESRRVVAQNLHKICESRKAEVEGDVKSWIRSILVESYSDNAVPGKIVDICGELFRCTVLSDGSVTWRRCTKEQALAGFSDLSPDLSAEDARTLGVPEEVEVGDVDAPPVVNAVSPPHADPLNRPGDDSQAFWEAAHAARTNAPHDPARPHVHVDDYAQLPWRRDMGDVYSPVAEEDRRGPPMPRAE